MSLKSVTIDDKPAYLLSSEQVQIFPCVNRDRKVDKYSRLSSEYNLTNIASYAIKSSYYIKKDNNDIPVDMVIGGYRIKLVNLTSLTDEEKDHLSSCQYFWVKPVTPTENGDVREQMLSRVVEPATNASSAPDASLDVSDYFYGLGMSANEPEGINANYILDKTVGEFSFDAKEIYYKKVLIEDKAGDYPATFLHNYIELSGKAGNGTKQIKIGTNGFYPKSVDNKIIIGSETYENICHLYGTASKAEQAEKLGTKNIGDDSTPIYLASGVPMKCTAMLAPVSDPPTEPFSFTQIKFLKQGKDEEGEDILYKLGGTDYTAGTNIIISDDNEINLETNLSGLGNIAATGNITTTTGRIQAASFLATSDARKKENIEDYKCEKSILDLPIKKFDFIDGPKNQIGCIAQDLQEICPEIVKEDDDGYLSIQESKLVYLLLQEVKELKKELKELKESR